MALKKLKIIDDVVDKFQLSFQKQNFLSNSDFVDVPPQYQTQKGEPQTGNCGSPFS